MWATGAMQSDRYWPEFITAVGRPDLVDDPRFATAQARTANRADGIGVLDVIFGAHSMEHWHAVLKDIEGVWAPALSPDEVLEDPQVRANGYLRPITLDDGETFEIVMSPIQFNERVPDLKRAPEHGEHTDEVLLELGYTMEQLIDLKFTGAVL
jgi:crotonobetainyl-CoA:carnitine CoA-transferase CaiB-like acyl-CoA transferase